LGLTPHITLVIPAKAGIQGFSRYYFNCNFAGGSPAAGHFLLCGQKKVTKENAALPSRPFGVPCVARAAGRLRNSRTCSIYGYWVGREFVVMLARPARSHSPRRLPPAALRYSAAHKGSNTAGFAPVTTVEGISAMLLLHYQAVVFSQF
jgi:hypothetical protein